MNSSMRRNLFVALISLAALAAALKLFMMERNPLPPDLNGTKVEDLKLPPEVSLTNETVNVLQQQIPYAVIRNPGLAMDCSPRTDAGTLFANIARNNNSLSVMLFSNRGRHALRIHGLHELTLSQMPSQPYQGLVPVWLNDSHYANAGLKISAVPSPEGNGMYLLLVSQTGKKYIPIGDFLISPTYSAVSKDFSLGATIKTNNHHDPICIILIDFEKLMIAGEIPLPMEMQRVYPCFILDPANNALLCFDWDLKWLIVIDLAPLFSTPAPPPEKTAPVQPPNPPKEAEKGEKF